jgi:CheY-like chemotaxis protein
MSKMLNILIIDDSNDKVANVIKVIREISSDIIVEIATDFISAQKQLILFQYDLLILDINLPIRIGEEPTLETGKNLLTEINRKASIKSPFYIISLSQYSDECENLSNIWQTIKYSPESIDWHLPIVDLIKHILKCNLKVGNQISLKPTLFLEGRTDEKILTEAMRLFKPGILEKISIRSEKSAGASWVSRQIIVWAHLLKKKDSHYLKALGLLDGDFAGKQALEEINRVVKYDSAESKTYKMFKLKPSYARHIIPIKQKGLDLPVTLEEMFCPDIWEYAKENSWLELRTNAESLLSNPEKWNKFDLSLKDYLMTIGLDEKENLYLYTFKDECKEELAKYIMELPEENRINALGCFKKLIDEIEEYLFG